MTTNPQTTASPRCPGRPGRERVGRTAARHRSGDLFSAGCGPYVRDRHPGPRSDPPPALLEPLCRRLARRLPVPRRRGHGDPAPSPSSPGYDVRRYAVLLAVQRHRRPDPRGRDQIHNWIRTPSTSPTRSSPVPPESAGHALSGAGTWANGRGGRLTVTHGCQVLHRDVHAVLLPLRGQRDLGWIVRLFPVRHVRVRVAPSLGTSGVAGRPCSWPPPQTPRGSVSAPLLLLGVPFASGIALLVFLGAFVPVVGALLSGIVAVPARPRGQGLSRADQRSAVVIAVQQIGTCLQPFPCSAGRSGTRQPVITAIAAGVVLWGIVPAR